MRARANALYLRRDSRVRLYRDHFELYSSQQDNLNGVLPVQTIPLGYPVTCNGTGDGTSGYPLDFDPKGLATMCSICLEQNGRTGAPDSIVISATRVNIGTKDKGDECKAANITIR